MNDPCPCGCGKKYKKCHGNPSFVNDEENLTGISNLSLYDRNIILINAAYDIFNLNDENAWERLKKNISNEQVREFYQLIATIWSPETDISKIFPTPDSKLRALYLGDVRPDFIIPNIFRFSLYADEIIIIQPFLNPWCVAKKFNPIDNPQTHKQEMLRLLFFLLFLEPWINSGLVKIVPDPGDFNYSLRTQMWDLAKERTKGWKPTKEELEVLEPHAKADFKRWFLTLPKKLISPMLDKTHPHLSDEEKNELFEYIDRLRESDPFAINQETGDTEGQLLSFTTGANLEMALYICKLTGSFPYTNLKRRWEEILSAKDNLSETSKTWSPLTKAFQSLDFMFLNSVDPKFALEIREEGRLESFRTFLRKLWRSIDGSPDELKIDDHVRDFCDELKDEHAKALADWDKISQDLKKWLGLYASGAVIGGKFALGIPTLGFGIAAVTQLLNTHSKRKNFKKKIPMSVFIDLENQ
ncbi:SEC-C domain-containing protein [candidate division KSB1 bacterium]|nr:SEC-C domain-containing protein [candidate division KSB1 bacterium]